MVKVKEPNGLLRRAFPLACEMFGEENVELSPLADNFFVFFSLSDRGLTNRIVVGYSDPDIEPVNGIVCVMSPNHYDKAMEFAERYESEVVGRKDGVILKKRYF